jgi:hypothetical protein
MPRGGYRPGAGRKKATPTEDRVEGHPTAIQVPAKARPRASKAPAKDRVATVRKAPEGRRQTANEFLIDVLNDASLPMADRLRAAFAVHSREIIPNAGKPPEEKGKKQVQQEKANEIAGSGGAYRPRTPPRLVKA